MAAQARAVGNEIWRMLDPTNGPEVSLGTAPAGSAAPQDKGFGDELLNDKSRGECFAKCQHEAGRCDSFCGAGGVCCRKDVQLGDAQLPHVWGYGHQDECYGTAMEAGKHTCTRSMHVVWREGEQCLKSEASQGQLELFGQMCEAPGLWPGKAQNAGCKSGFCGAGACCSKKVGKAVAKQIKALGSETEEAQAALLKVDASWWLYGKGGACAHAADQPADAKQASDKHVCMPPAGVEIKKRIADFTKEDVTVYIAGNREERFKKSPSVFFAWSNPDFIELMAVLMRATHLHKGYYPREVQVTALLIFLDSHAKADPANGEDDGYVLDATTGHMRPKDGDANKAQAMSLGRAMEVATRGRLVQVPTGEGKTMISAILASAMAINGKHVDLITASKVLAKQGYEQWSDYFDIVKVPTSINCDAAAERDQDVRMGRYASSLVMYGDMGSFIRDALMTEDLQKQIRPVGVSLEKDVVAIYDEVDAMMIDEINKSLYITHGVEDLKYVTHVLFNIWELVNQPLGALADEDDDDDSDSASSGGAKSLESDPDGFGWEMEEEKLAAERAREGAVNKLMREGDLAETEQAAAGKMGEAADKKRKRDDAMRLFRRAVRQKLRRDRHAEGDDDDDGKNSSGSGEGAAFAGPKKSKVEEDYEKEKSLSVDDPKVTAIANTVYKMIVEKALLPVPRQLLTPFAGSEEAGFEPFVSERQLQIWVKNAFHVKHNINKDNSFIMPSSAVSGDHAALADRVVPVDKLSGVEMANTQWGDAIHQFAQLKHAKVVDPLKLKAVYSSYLFYNKRYSKIFGMTGTLGGRAEKALIHALYDTDFFTIPSFCNEKKFVEDDPLVVVAASNDAVSQRDFSAQHEALWKELTLGGARLKVEIDHSKSENAAEADLANVQRFLVDSPVDSLPEEARDKARRRKEQKAREWRGLRYVRSAEQLLHVDAALTAGDKGAGFAGRLTALKDIMLGYHRKMPKMMQEVEELRQQLERATLLESGGVDARAQLDGVVL